MADPNTANPKRAPWRAMLLVAAATALAIWLVPSNHEVDVVNLPPTPTAEPTPAPAPAPAAKSTPAPAPTAEPARPSAATASPGSTARTLIAAQRAAGKPDPQAAYDEAVKLAKAGQAEDAYLLDFYAARLGHADAAFTLAEQADPAHWQPGGTLKAPAPEQALRWYRAAAEAGHPDAAKRIDALREWAQSAAARGDAQAQRLMLAW